MTNIAKKTPVKHHLGHQNANIVLMPKINLKLTSIALQEKVLQWNKKNSKKVRAQHFRTLWHIVNVIAKKMANDNKNSDPVFRALDVTKPERMLWTDQITRKNIADHIFTACLDTVTNHLQRLTDCGFIHNHNRSIQVKSSEENEPENYTHKHLTNIIRLASDFIIIEDASNPNFKLLECPYLAKKGLKIAFRSLENQKPENQLPNLSKTEKPDSLLNNTKKDILNNKLMGKRCFVEKSTKRASHSRHLPEHPKAGETDIGNQYHSSKRILSRAEKSEDQILEDYRRSAANHVFSKSLILWEHRDDVYSGEYKKAQNYVENHYFKRCTTIEQIDSEVKAVLWGINFQKNQRKKIDGKLINGQFVFFPKKYFSEQGTGTLYATRKFYQKFLNDLQNNKKVAKTHPAESYLNIKQSILKFLNGNRSLRSFRTTERHLKTNWPGSEKEFYTAVVEFIKN